MLLLIIPFYGKITNNNCSFMQWSYLLELICYCSNITMYGLKGEILSMLIKICLLFLLISAASVSFIKSNLSVIIVFSAYSLIMAIVWILMESPDLAITEAAVGAGVTSILFYGTLKRIHRIDLSFDKLEGLDEENENDEEE